MDPKISIGISVILLSLIIYLFVILSRVKSDISDLKEDNSIPAHTHEPNVIDTSGDSVPVGLSQSEVDARIRAIAPELSVTSDSSGNIYRNASVQELGFEYQNTGDKLIFNKETDFNQPVFIHESLKGGDVLDSSGSRIGSMLNILGSVNVEYNITVQQHAQIMRNVWIEGSLSSENENINITPYANMIAPFFINFNTADEITKLQSRHWYLCNGEPHTVNDISRTTPDLRGRFIWGGGAGKNNDADPDSFVFQNGKWITGPGDSYNRFRGTVEQECCGKSRVNLAEGEIPKHQHTITQWNTRECTGSQCPLYLSEHSINHYIGNGDPPHIIPNSTDRYAYDTARWKTHKDGGSNQDLGQSHQNLPPYMVLAYFIYWPEPWDDEEPWAL